LSPFGTKVCSVVDFEELMERNGKFAEKQDKETMARLCKGQKPHTIVLTCSDSRVVPEFIFGCGIGELFVIRVAGNVACDCDVVASLEYAAEHLHCKTLVVLGHTNCGAVCAACEGNGSGNIAKLLCQVMPAVEKTNRNAGEAVLENVRLQTQNLLERSSLVAEFAHSGELKVVCAVYDLLSGRVSVLDYRES
jgi:carbonic anhydrase